MRRTVENRTPKQSIGGFFAHTPPRAIEAMRAVAIASSRRMFSKGHLLTRSGELDEDARDVHEQNVAGKAAPCFSRHFGPGPHM